MADHSRRRSHPHPSTGSGVQPRGAHEHRAGPWRDDHRGGGGRAVNTVQGDRRALAGIIGNLLLVGSHYDIAPRDLGLLLAALALERLATAFQPIHDAMQV
jgi:hypothetical protein